MTRRAAALAFTGDGGLLMGLGELATATTLGVKLVVVVFNDATLSLIDIKKDKRDLPDGALGWPRADLAAAMRSMGGVGLTRQYRGRARRGDGGRLRGDRAGAGRRGGGPLGLSGADQGAAGVTAFAPAGGGAGAAAHRARRRRWMSGRRRARCSAGRPRRQEPRCIGFAPWGAPEDGVFVVAVPNDREEIVVALMRDGPMASRPSSPGRRPSSRSWSGRSGPACWVWWRRRRWAGGRWSG